MGGICLLVQLIHSIDSSGSKSFGFSFCGPQVNIVGGATC